VLVDAWVTVADWLVPVCTRLVDELPAKACEAKATARMLVEVNNSFLIINVSCC
jgi:hypothetical protein